MPKAHTSKLQVNEWRQETSNLGMKNIPGTAITEVWMPLKNPRLTRTAKTTTIKEI